MLTFTHSVPLVFQCFFFQFFISVTCAIALARFYFFRLANLAQFSSFRNCIKIAFKFDSNSGSRIFFPDDLCNCFGIHIFTSRYCSQMLYLNGLNYTLNSTAMQFAERKKYTVLITRCLCGRWNYHFEISLSY